MHFSASSDGTLCDGGGGGHRAWTGTKANHSPGHVRNGYALLLYCMSPPALLAVDNRSRLALVSMIRINSACAEPKPRHRTLDSGMTPPCKGVYNAGCKRVSVLGLGSTRLTDSIFDPRLHICTSYDMRTYISTPPTPANGLFLL